MTTVLKIAGLNVIFDTGLERIKALNDVSIDIKKGEVLGIIGASGSGKSTLLSVLIGLNSPNQITQGELHHHDYNGQNQINWSNLEWQSYRQDQIGILFQNALQNLNPSKQIDKHFKAVFKLKGRPYNEETALKYLRRVRFNEDLYGILKSFPHQLSGGQQQRVLLALMLAQETKILLLDEPFSSLDYDSQENIVNLLQDLIKTENLTVLISSHDLDVMRQITDSIVVFDSGEIVESGTTKAILSQPKHPFTQALINAQKLAFPRRANGQSKVVLNIKKLSHYYLKGRFLQWKKTKVPVLSALNLSLKQGEILGIVGPSGSGKTTIVNLILGNIGVQEGLIGFNGVSLDEMHRKSRKDLSKQIVLIPQNSNDAFDPKMLFKEGLQLIWNTHYLKSNENFIKTVKNLMQDLELENRLLERYPSELSGGQIQRMAILRALLIRPQILIFDESLTALDMIVQKQILDLIHKLNHKLTISIIIISHDQRVVEAISHRIIYLKEGKVQPHS